MRLDMRKRLPVAPGRASWRLRPSRRLSVVTVAGQGAAKAARTPWGYPDIQGLYNTAWLTPLERPAQVAATTLTPEQAAAAEKAAADARQRRALPSDPTRTAPPVGGDGSTGASGNVGGYNNFWIDNGEEYFSINGERRTSIVVDPPDGRIPPTTPEARKRQAAPRSRRRLRTRRRTSPR